MERVFGASSPDTLHVYYIGVKTHASRAGEVAQQALVGVEDVAPAEYRQDS